jgi:hypothetical protein
MSPEKFARFKEELEKRIAEMGQRQAVNAPAGFTGEAIAAPLEHTVRIQLLDHFLKALGWRMEALIEEARVKQDTTLFLDYQPLRYLHDCSGCFRLERLPGGACTHWKAPPCHGARQ